MITYTENYKLLEQSQDSFFDVSVLNENLDLLDKAVKNEKEDTIKWAGRTFSNPNLLINGDFQVWQRGELFNKNGAYYVADRWKIDASGTGGTSVTKGYDATVGNYMRVSITEYANVWYTLEPSCINELKGKQLTLSFYARKIDGNYVNAVYGMFDKMMYANDVTSDWKKFSVTTSIPDNISLQIMLPAFIESQNGVNVTWDIAQVKLEIGEVATPFVPRSYGDELALCQRYYQKTYSDNINSGAIDYRGGKIVYAKDNYVAIPFYFDLNSVMRITPTVKLYSPETGVEGYARSANGQEIQIQVGQAYSNNKQIVLASVNGNFVKDELYYIHYVADAEIY